MTVQNSDALDLKQARNASPTPLHFHNEKVELGFILEEKASTVRQVESSKERG